MAFSLIPDLMFDSVEELTPELLRARGVRLLMMDFDNTIVPYTTDLPTASMDAWLRRMTAGDITLCMVSNTKKPRVEAFCARYGIPCIRRAKKPFPGHGIEEALRRFSCAPSEAALVGDQIYTDVLGANLSGAVSIHVRAICQHTVLLKLRHLLELPFIAIGRLRLRGKRN